MVYSRISCGSIKLDRQRKMCLRIHGQQATHEPTESKIMLRQNAFESLKAFPPESNN